MLVELILSSARTREIRLISVYGEMVVHHVDEGPWECTIGY